MWPNAVISLPFQGSRPNKPGNTYAKQNNHNATRGNRRTALWVTMAGVGLVIQIKKGSSV